jgi:hypothetical protein
MKMKTCKTCQETKPDGEFYRNRRVCRICYVGACKEYQEDNSERFRQYQSDYYVKNKGQRNKTTKEWYEKNRDHARQYSSGYNQKNKERLKPIRKAWEVANKDKRAAVTHRYRAKKLRATPPWLTEEHNKQIEEFFWLAQDLRSVSGEDYHVDHIVPLQGKNVCGLHVPWNLQILPGDLNVKKSNTFKG